jgi:hypothetical protein
MKAIPILLGISILLNRAAEPQIEWGRAIEGFSIGLALSNSIYTVNEPMLVTMYIRNETTENKSLPVSTVDVFWSFAGTDASGHPLRAKPFETEISGIASILLSPGAVDSVTVNLRDFLAITNSGDFLINAKRIIDRKIIGLSGNAMVRVFANDSLSENLTSVPPNSSSAKVANLGLRRTTNHSFDSLQHHSEAPSLPPSSKSMAGVAPPLGGTQPISDSHAFSSGQKIGAGIVAGLLAALFAILWRAARRKPEA